MEARMRTRTALCGLWLLALCSTGQAGSWPAWDEFTGRFLQEDGRIVDLTFDQKSTSEGQSYGLFFALVANDRTRFDRILHWTSQNLAAGKLGDRLPGWLWGKGANGGWGLKDANAASDADLWIAYTLLQAERLWNAPEYGQLGRRLLKLIKDSEVVDAGKAGPQLLPGPIGFDLGGGRYRIDPSYLPNFMFRYLAGADPDGPWQAIWNGYARAWPQLFARGIAPNFYVIDRKGRVWPDSEAAPVGSYDAIRVYLWAAMSGADGREMLRLLKPYAALIHAHGAPPEKVDPLSGRIVSGDWSPLAFQGAILPYLQVQGEQELLDQQLRKLRLGRMKAKLMRNANYYDEALTLFGLGWVEGYYRFDEQGRVWPRWVSQPGMP